MQPSRRCFRQTLMSNVGAAAFEAYRSGALPPAAHPALWSPPAMTPGTPAPSPTSAPMWITPMWTAVRRRSPPRLRFALRRGQRQAHAESRCPARGIPDQVTAINHSLQPLCIWLAVVWATALADQYLLARSATTPLLGAGPQCSRRTPLGRGRDA